MCMTYAPVFRGAIVLGRCPNPSSDEVLGHAGVLGQMWGFQLSIDGLGGQAATL